MGPLSLTENHRLRTVLVTAGYVLIPLSYIGLLALGPSAGAYEDGLIENLGAILALLAAILFLVAFLRSSGSDNRFLGRSTRRNVWLLLLAALMLFWCGEEISWGQRIFGWATPSFLLPLNVQGETSIHNLVLFHPRDAAGNSKTGLAMMLSFNRLLNVFWLTYFVVVPVLHSSLAIARNGFAWMGIPIPVFPVALLFPANYAAMRLAGEVAEKVGEAGSLPSFHRAINELCETNFALCLALFGAWLLLAAPRALAARGEPFRHRPEPQHGYRDHG